jgi:hypothetical protein
MRKRKTLPLWLRIFVFFPALFFLACVSEPGQQSESKAEAEEAGVNELVYHLTDYKTRAEGGAIPQWVGYYLAGNIAALEALEEYGNRYAFVAHSRGTNFRAQEQWVRGFLVGLDFARLAAVRIEKRFTLAASGFPDTVFGRYFEALIRAASDASWEGAVKEDDFWLKGFYQEADGDGRGGESYDFMILVTIDKAQLASQIQPLLSSVNPQAPMSRDQLAAVNRVRDRFFDEF